MSWDDFFSREDIKNELKKINKEIKKQKNEGITIYPSKENRFKCFEITELENVKVVLIGQDIYINEINGIPQGQGLCFSVPDKFPFPPSLENIFKELKNDLGYEIPKSGNLTKWAERGVLLLNRSLSVQKGKSNSHKKLWTTFSKELMKFIFYNKNFVFFICWGNDALDSIRGLNLENHIVLTAKHPSPLSANKGGFFGNKHFSKCNKILKDKHIKEIDWNINILEN